MLTFSVVNGKAFIIERNIKADYAKFKYRMTKHRIIHV